MINKNGWLDQTRLVEEEPHVEDYRYYLWSGPERGTVWRGMTKAAGEAFAASVGLTIDAFEGYEP